jgi:hypothetical protein
MKQLRKLIPLQLLALILVFSCFCIDASAQKSAACKLLLKKTINTDVVNDIASDIIKHADCLSLDSIDMKIFGDGSTLKPILAKHPSPAGKYTYGAILTDINEYKRDTAYTSLRNWVVAQNALEGTKISLASWDGIVKYLKIIGMPDSEMEPFHRYLIEKKEKRWNYRQLMVAYQMKKQADSPAKQ